MSQICSKMKAVMESGGLVSDDIVVGIIKDRIQKADLYHRVGVPWLWILDPAAQTVESYQREEAGYLRVAAVAGSVEARIPPFDAVAIDLSPWWAGDEEE